MDVLPEDVLFRWEDDFAEDFDFADIKMESVHTILFTEQECNVILSYTKRREQIKKMFDILVDGRKNLNIFIDVLAEKYDWLADKLKREDRSAEMEMFKRQVDSLRAELPKHLDLNVKRTKYVSYCGMKMRCRMGTISFLSQNLALRTGAKIAGLATT